MLLAFFFLWLAIFSFLPLILVELGGYDGTFLQKLEAMLGQHDSLIVSLGTVALVSALALWTQIVASNSSERSQDATRFLDAELKLSEFRQAWINALREDIANTISEASTFFESKTDEEKSAKMAKLKLLDSRIRMRLKPDGDDELAIDAALVTLVEALEGDDEKTAIIERERLAELGAKYLKVEWEKIKSRLEDLKTGKRF